MQLGERVRKIRLAKGMTQAQVAGEHMTRNMLSQIENGAASPSVKSLEYLAEQLGVSAGYLLSEDDNGRLKAAKKNLRSGDIDGALEAAADCESDEGWLLLAWIYREYVRRCFDAGEITTAADYAQKALVYNDKTLYKSRDIEAEMRWLIAYAEMDGENAAKSIENYRNTYDSWGWEAKNHLLRARYYLMKHQNQAAEREVWMITSLPDTVKAQYLLLRGEIAVRQEKYVNAISYLKQVEEMQASNKKMRMELYRLLEIAYREMQDFKAAYEYAAKQRET